MQFYDCFLKIITEIVHLDTNFNLQDGKTSQKWQQKIKMKQTIAFSLDADTKDP